ncbi:hypothetical protein ABPD29_01220 [Secundilactobacillus paracollinoides]|uniref:hypothetical protein n=1 Tax=Secundilactobacillus paracollinoides TaxID=240427 RepID=UPI003F454833
MSQMQAHNSTTSQSDERPEDTKNPTSRSASAASMKRRTKPTPWQQLTPSRAHLGTVIRFLLANSLTLGLIFLLAIIFSQYRWWFFAVWIIASYLYPLLLNKSTWPWERRLFGWLHQSSEPRSEPEPVYGEPASARQPQSAAPQVAPQFQQTAESEPPAATANNRRQGFRQVLQRLGNPELKRGIIFLLVGEVLKWVGGSIASESLSTQITSMINSSTVSFKGYCLIVSYLLIGWGVFAIGGGIVKLLFHHQHGGRLYKLAAVVIGILTTVIVGYLYGHPVDGGYQLTTALIGSNMTTSSLLNIINWVPWVFAILYLLGILKNALRRNRFF